MYADSMKYTIGNSTYTYYVTTNNTVTITSYAGTDTKIKIPERIEDKLKQ